MEEYNLNEMIQILEGMVFLRDFEKDFLKETIDAFSSTEPTSKTIAELMYKLMIGDWTLEEVFKKTIKDTVAIIKYRYMENEAKRRILNAFNIGMYQSCIYNKKPKIRVKHPIYKLEAGKIAQAFSESGNLVGEILISFDRDVRLMVDAYTKEMNALHGFCTDDFSEDISAIARNNQALYNFVHKFFKAGYVIQTMGI